MMVMGLYRAVLNDTWWYWVSRLRYLLVFGGTVSLLGGKGLSCLYILKKVEIWLDVTIAGRTNKQKRKDRATQPLDHGRLR